MDVYYNLQHSSGRDMMTSNALQYVIEKMFSVNLLFYVCCEHLNEIIQ